MLQFGSIILDNGEFSFRWWFNNNYKFFVKLKVPLQVPLMVKVKVKVKVKVRTWSGHGQVRSNSNSNSNSKVGPELYTKIGFHSPTHPLTTTTPSLNECLERRVLSKSCLYHHDGPQNDQGWSRMTSGWPQDDLRMTWLFSNCPC